MNTRLALLTTTITITTLLRNTNPTHLPTNRHTYIHTYNSQTHTHTTFDEEVPTPW